MMKTIEETQIYIHMIELLRKERKIPLLTFLEGITSERSYRRYLLEGKDIPLKILESLMKSLGVTVMDMIMYTLQVAIKPSGVIELIQYTYHAQFELAKPYRESLDTYKGDKTDLNTLILYFKNLYDYEISLNKDAFDRSCELFKTIPIEDQNQLEGFSVYVLKHILFNKKDDPFISNTFLQGQLHLYQIVLYTQILDMYLNDYITKPYYDKETYQKLSIHMYKVANMWIDSYNLYSATFHYAHQFYELKDEKLAHTHIYKYLNLHTLTQCTPIKKERIAQIENIIKTDIQTFIKTYTPTFFKPESI